MTSAQDIRTEGRRSSISDPGKRPIYVYFVHILFPTILLGLFILLPGCTELIIVAGEKAYTHLRGDFMGIVPDKLDNVYTASMEAAAHMDDYQVLDHRLTAINGEITALDDNAEKTTIILSKTETDQTQIQIRIGAFGDKIKSVHIYDCIQLHLKHPKVARAPF
jgi:hypothetical protein